MRKVVESIIRDYLFENINMISKDLTAIEIEHKLNNEFGSSGSIDILAKDRDNNYVIIEVKRSNGAARSALHEITKYVALLKMKYKIKESEIRIILISSEWDELIVPFSKYCQDIDLYIEGYEMTLDENNLPISIQAIDPILVDSSRNFSRQSMFFFYSTRENEDDIVSKIDFYMNKFGIKDYVIVLLNALCEEMPYSFGVYVAFKEYSIDYYISIIKYIEGIDENLIIELENSYGHDNMEHGFHLEEELLCKIISHIKCNEYENGSPEKISSAFKNWKVDSVLRRGIYESDIRLSDKQIIIELCSLDERNRYVFFDYLQSKNKAKFNQILKNFPYCLSNNKKWKHHIELILLNLKKEISSYRLQIEIFNPCRILEVIAGTINSGSYSYFPSYEIIIDYADGNKVDIYRGMITWEKKDIDFNEMFSKFFDGKKDDFFFKIHLGIIEEINDEVMNYLGLKYSSELITIFHDSTVEQKHITVQDGELYKELFNEKNIPVYFDDFIIAEPHVEFNQNVVDFFFYNTFGYING